MFASKKIMTLSEYFEALISEILFNSERYPDETTINETSQFSNAEMRNIANEMPNLAFVYLFFVTKELQTKGHIKSLPVSMTSQDVDQIIGESFSFALVKSIFMKVPTTISQSEAADIAQSEAEIRLEQYLEYMTRIEKDLEENNNEPYSTALKYFQGRTVALMELTNEKNFALLILAKFIKNEIINDLVGQVVEQYNID